MPTNALSTAVSGLNAATTRLAVSANNVANAFSSGRPGDPGSPAYQAQDVQQSAVPGGGTRATVVARNPATQLAFDPASLRASDSGLVEIPNVDFGEELVAQRAAAAAFKASAAVIRTVDEQQRELLDATA